MPNVNQVLGEDDVPTRSQLVEMIRGVDGRSPKHQVRNRALFSFAYLTGGRISEIVKRVKKINLELGHDDGRDILFVKNFYTLKNRRHPNRTLPIPVYLEEEIYQFLDDYLETLKPMDTLFDFSRVSAWKIISGAVAKFKDRSRNRMLNACHFLRHTRNSHLVTYYKFTDQQLVQWNGWSNSEPVKYYMHLRTSGLLDTFRRSEDLKN